MRIAEEWSLKTVPPENEIGIEIEMEGRGIPTAPIGWNGVPDGSLRGESLEYVLTQPVPRNTVGPMLDILAKQFARSKTQLNPSDRCGIHVHINCQQLTTPQVINFALSYLFVEDPLVAWCGPTREGNLFCLRGKDAEGLYGGLIKCKRDMSLRHLQRDTFRYASINLSAIHKYGSVEFRPLKTTTDFLERTQKWVNILTSIKDKSLSFDSSVSLIEEMAKDPIKFAESALGENSAEILRKYPDLKNTLKDAKWRIQDVAYTEEAKKEKKKPNDDLIDSLINLNADRIPASVWAFDSPVDFSSNDEGFIPEATPLDRLIFDTEDR